MTAISTPVATRPAIQRRGSSLEPLLYAARAFLSFETLFLVFLFAGRFKADPRFGFIPVDLTALALVLSTLSGVYIACRSSHRMPGKAGAFLVVSGCFFGYVVGSYAWSIGYGYAWYKAQYVAVLTTFPTVYCAVILSSSRRRLVRFLWMLTALAAWISFERFVFARQDVVGDASEVLGGNYLGIGRVVGMATLVCLVFGLKRASTPHERSLCYALVGLFSIVLLTAGGRMPCLATAAAAATIPLVSRAHKIRKATRRRGSIALLLVMAIGAGYVALKHGDDSVEFRTLKRLEVLFVGDDFGASGDARIEMWRSAIAAWREEPLFGHGLGSFPILHYHEDGRSYPHNLFMEVAAETGAIGIALLCMMLLLAYRNLTAGGALRKDPLRLTVFVLLVNGGCNAMVSGDIPDNRVLFGLLGLSCLVGVRVLRHAKDNPPHLRPHAV